MNKYFMKHFPYAYMAVEFLNDNPELTIISLLSAIGEGCYLIYINPEYIKDHE